MSSLQMRVVSALPDQVIQRLSRAKGWIVNRRSRRFYEPLAKTVFPSAESSDLLVANDDAAVFRVTMSPETTVILKLARTPIADELLAAESAALDELHGFDELGDWRALIAQVQDRGTHDSGTWFTQSDLPGVTTFRAESEDDHVVALSVAALQPVHRATGEIVTVTDSVLAELASDALALVKQWRPAQAGAIDTIDSDLRRRLAGRELHLSRMHGDFAPTNVLWDNAGAQVAGIVDWKFSDELAPPEVDLVHFPISLLMERTGTEYGTTVIRLLDDEVDPEHRTLVQQAVEAGPNDFDTETAVCLAWLHHIAFGLHKAPNLRVNPIWLHNNIDSVIEHLASS